MKLLGFHLSNKPGVTAHFEALRKRFRQRFWVLIRLRTLGFNTEELVKLDKTSVCSVAEYCAMVFHSQLTDEQDDLLERQQNYALKLIYGPGISAGTMRSMAGIPTLRQRRITLCDKFAAKACTNQRFMRWFPLSMSDRPSRATSNPGRNQETYARCDRLRDSQVHFMRRRLNGKVGRTYGQRNQFWRER